ncbi:MAG: hypothetical protein H6Q73_3754 [Firmicutes bacterium]|nr:hypothetical protein [Bacillota bacterium]
MYAKKIVKGTMMKGNHERKAAILVFDVGSTFTKANAFSYNEGEIAWLAFSQAPTTVKNIDIGLNEAIKSLACQLGEVKLEAEYVYSASSAAGGLRMVAMGYMPRVTAKAAKEVAMNAGARVLEVMSYDDEAEYKLEMLQEIRPDIILLAGGTDGGDIDNLVNDAKIIVKSGMKATVVIAGNQTAQPLAQTILDEANIPTVRVPNVMPIIHELKVKPAREAIHQQFIHQITKAKGLSKLIDILTVQKVVPTPGAVMMAAELLAKGTPEEEGIDGLVVVDLGGATTDIHSVLPYLDKLSLEEKGLVLTNEKQTVYRTVEGNLGLRVSALGIVETVGPKALLARIGLAGAEKEQAIVDYATALEKDPEHLAANAQETAFDQAMAEAAVEIALKRHAGFISQQFDPIMGIVPGMPMGRDLRQVKTVIAIGGIFAHSPLEKSTNIINRALANPDISLLPINPQIVIDQNYLLYAVGILAQYHATAALKFAKKHFNLI